MPKVALSMDNVKKCLCGLCPVQAKSACSKDKLTKLMAVAGKMPAGTMAKPADIPGLYCSTGKATCPDLDPTQACICARCPNWESYKLAEGTPLGYFCRDGQAK